MTKDFLASTSGKQQASSGGRVSPFDQIAAKEAEENARVQTELDAMQTEEQQVKQALQDKEEHADKEMKDAARQELVTYRENELSTIVQNAEREGQKAADALESVFDQKKEALIQELTEQFTHYSPNTDN